MKQFTLKIDMENDAFKDYASNELARMLDELSKKIWRQGVYFLQQQGHTSIKDINGNKIGCFEVIR